jgi:GAF domain-containing protein
MSTQTIAWPAPDFMADHAVNTLPDALALEVSAHWEKCASCRREATYRSLDRIPAPRIWASFRPSATDANGLRSYFEAIDASRALALDIEGTAQRLAEDVRAIGFEYATVQMIWHGVVEAVAATGPARAWALLARHPLDRELPDIHVAVARARGYVEEITGWDDRFDTYLYNRFHHEKHRRLFLPLVVHRDAHGAICTWPRCTWQEFNGRRPDVAPRSVLRLRHARSCQPLVIGTMEAGVVDGSREFTPEMRLRLARLASAWAPTIYRSTLAALFEDVVLLGRDLLDADSAAFVFSRASEAFTIQRGARGPRRSKSKIADGGLDAPPRTEGIGAEALRRGRASVCLGPELEKRDKVIVRQGIQTLVAAPIYAAPTRGVLYLRWQGNREPSHESMGLLDLFAKYVGSAIQTVVDHEAARRRAIRQSAVDTIIEALRSRAPDARRQVADGLLNILGADVVALRPAGDRWSPLTAGRLRHREHEKAPILGATERIAGGDGPVFTAAAQREPILKPRGKRSFFAKEGIVACAGVRLTSGSTGVGAMFVGFRRPHRFTGDEKELIQLAAKIASSTLDREARRATVRQWVELEAEMRLVGSSLESEPEYWPRTLRTVEADYERPAAEERKGGRVIPLPLPNATSAAP